jgi:pimeloyl-ACP methyl ester carboxylesterase
LIAPAWAIGSVLLAGPASGQVTPTRPIITESVYTKPAQLVDIGGGRRLNLYCRGTGSPAVIFDSGLNDSSIAWALVQPQISKTHTTCSYDRAGLGFSDAANHRGTAADDVEDIHKALQVIHVKPPYVVVGHSAGGMAVRVFADRYRDEVVGMVIVDGSHEDQSARSKAIASRDAQAHWDDDLEDTTCVDAAKTGEIPKNSPVYTRCVGEPDARMSQAINDAQMAYGAKLTYQTAVAAEYHAFYGASADQARATRRDFGDMPLIVLTQSPQPPRHGRTQAEQDKRTVLLERMHNEMADMSRRGVNEIVPRSGHLIPYDRPEIVVDAIRQVLDMVAAPPPPAADTTRTNPLITDPVYTKPDRLVDIGGGRRINLHCRGTGGPTVVFDAGALDSSIAWALVQPTISEKHATCSFDRAGMGFSDAQVRPGTSANEVDDLHLTLQAAHIKPPYVLVGASAAGLAVRVFADRFRDEVVGIVFVDGSHEDQGSRLKAIALPEALAHWNDKVTDTTCVDALKDGEIPKDSPAYKTCVGEPDPRFSKAINDVMLHYTSKAKYQMASTSEIHNFWSVSADQTRATRRDFGDMPMIFLSHAPYKPATAQGVTQELQDKRTLVVEQMHNEVAAMSTHGVNVLVPRTGHVINYDRPGIVIDAVNQALAIAAEQAGPSQ